MSPLPRLFTSTCTNSDEWASMRYEYFASLLYRCTASRLGIRVATLSWLLSLLNEAYSSCLANQCTSSNRFRQSSACSLSLPSTHYFLTAFRSSTHLARELAGWLPDSILLQKYKLGLQITCRSSCRPRGTSKSSAYRRRDYRYDSLSASTFLWCGPKAVGRRLAPLCTCEAIPPSSKLQRYKEHVLVFLAGCRFPFGC